ncbi:MAG TPA: carboxypeptidase regulatory-like domain-containing protein [Planctomycetota bacterium]
MRRLAVGLALLAACDSADGPGDPDPVVTVTPVDPATSGTLRGSVAFKGTPPPNPRLAVGGSPECAVHHAGDVRDEIVLVKDGRLRNVFVYVKAGLEGRAFAWPKEPARIANRACLYVPRVSGAQVHQPIEFVNEDPSDHNIHGYPSGGAFNRWLRGRGSSTSLKLRRPEVMIKLRCDIHPWMVGWLGVVAHPFFAVTGEDGSFSFAGLPPGEYEVAAWHEKYGEKTLKATLGPKGDVALDYVFSP